MHTHPYTDEESTRLGIDHGSFSATDLAAIVEENQPLNILRSGPYTYLIARTREFNALVKRHEASETTDDLKRSMFELHDTTFKSAKGTFEERLEAAVTAVCARFHLLYYRGEGRALQRVSPTPVP